MYFLTKLAIGLVVLAIGYGVYGLYVWSVERAPVQVTLDQYFRAGERPRWIVLTDCQLDYTEGFKSRIAAGMKDEAWFVPIRAIGGKAPARLVLEVRSPERLAILENRVPLTAEQYLYRGPVAGFIEYTTDKTRRGIVKAGREHVAAGFDVLTENERPQFLLPSLSLLAGLGAVGGFLWLRFGPAAPPPPRPQPADPQRHPIARSPREMIEQTRQIAGRPPRDIAPYEGLLITPPPWLQRGTDRMREIYAMEQTLLREGQIVWAQIVQANSLLFSPGMDDCPGVAVYSPDPCFDDHPEQLDEIASRLFDIKGAQTDPDLQAFADILEDERTTAMRLPVPPRLTNGREVIYTTIVVRRKDLPDGRLSAGFFPLLIQPTKTQATMILPWEWWSPALVALWRE